MQSAPDLLQPVLPLGLIAEAASDGGEDLLFPSLDEQGVVVLGGLVPVPVLHIRLIVSVSCLGSHVGPGGREVLVGWEQFVVYGLVAVVLCGGEGFIFYKLSMKSYSQQLNEFQRPTFQADY